MVKNLIELFEIPRSALVDRKLDKKRIYDRGGLTPAQKRLLSDEVERIRVVASLGPRSINVPAYEDEYLRYKQIPLLWLDVRQNGKVGSVLSLIHKVIEHPVLIWTTVPAGTVLFSAATKRINQNDATTLTVVDEYTSPEMTEEDIQTLGDSLHLSRQSLSSVRELYLSYCRWISDRTIKAIIGDRSKTALSLNEQRELLERYNFLEKELQQTKNRARKESQSQKQIDLNKRIREMKSEMQDITEQLKGKNQ